MKKVKVSKKPSVKEFTELKTAWQGQQYYIRDLNEYNLELRVQLSELRSVITRYEIFTISVVALVMVHIAWVIS